MQTQGTAPLYRESARLGQFRSALDQIRAVQAWNIERGWGLNATFPRLLESLPPWPDGPRDALVLVPNLGEDTVQKLLAVANDGPVRVRLALRGGERFARSQSPAKSVTWEYLTLGAIAGTPAIVSDPVASALACIILHPVWAREVASGAAPAIAVSSPVGSKGVTLSCAPDLQEGGLVLSRLPNSR